MDKFYIREAIRLAKKGIGRTSPNPAVGAVIVKNGRVVGKGWHKKAGSPHAEIEALSCAGRLAKNATLYVNLEPCSHYGRTPPCTDAIIKAGISRVVCSICDPNPLICGVEALQKKGIIVDVGLLAKEATELNEPYLKYINTKRPYILLKIAASLDGRITSPTERWISCEKSRRLVHKMRAEMDAVLVGKGTVIKDDPELTVRLAKGKNPACIILGGNLPSESKLFRADRQVIIATTKEESLNKGEVLVTKAKDGLVDLNDLMDKLGGMGITSILVEGGRRVITSFLKEKLLDRACFFISTKVIGENGLAMTEQLPFSINLSETKIRRIGEDIMVSGKYIH
ncbi:MAG: bifunctional diaminohydroxyphosphoribosylaminopyrimidine deaminase/5-amino-6-(5-phosphoribosylamino)uracil reductase RibD [bacterium]|nr:bifunctional diaminohydroxyphosphoribosylaminopyrimidine deaminase/5-amino-6-(5-phosphoribosylamino)uracil reductase RibD [bacterium]